MGNACGCVDNKEIEKQDDAASQPANAKMKEANPQKSAQLDHAESKNKNPTPAGKDAKAVVESTGAGGKHESTKVETGSKPAAIKDAKETSNVSPQFGAAPKLPVVESKYNSELPKTSSVKIPSPKNQLIKSTLSHLGKFQPFSSLAEKDIMKKQLSPGVYYEGQENAAGKKAGIGRVIYESGPIIEGYFKDDNLEGDTRIIKENGDYFVGKFVKGKAEGKGKYCKNGGEEYDGEFKGDKPHGKGFLKYANGNKYDGTFVDGLRDGKGKFVFFNKDTYEGDFARGEFNGKGVYMWHNEGKKYDGDWRDGKMEGKGKFTWKDGRSYEGGYKAGQKSGHGVMSFTGGYKYDGEWLNGKQHGAGKLVGPDGKTVSEGKWDNGKLVF